MHRGSTRLPIVASLALGALFMLSAAGAALSVGSKAPALGITDWIKGEPVKEFQPGTVYVVEFWATWCGPCIRGIPKLTELQKEHEGSLVVIGVAAFERGAGQTPDLRRQKLQSFVDARSASMKYRIAFDPAGQSGTNWMTAAGQRGIPCAFIVNHEGIITYIGMPTGMEGALNAALRKAKDAKSKSAPDAAPKSPDSSSAPPTTSKPKTSAPTPPAAPPSGAPTPSAGGAA